MLTLRKLTFFLVFLTIFLILQSCDGRIFSFKMHHRFSDPVKKWSEAAGNLSPADNLPEKGSFEYYAELADRDRFLRGRKLVESDTSPLAFSDGNSTFQIRSLGYLHYTTVQLGTPGMKFMVALDTGSDLFWVPCEGTAYAPNFEVSKYDPKGSSTSKRVSCNNSLCAHRNRCLGRFNNCPYMVSYVSAETSTSGILVEDVLHLTTEDSHHEIVDAYITFGCGQVQSGSFLDVAAPNGLFGLGMEKISVPSILSREGFTADSFSMCFGHDGIGRINFGDKGSPDQEETPFNYNPSRPTYNISVTQIRVGTDLMDIDFTALFDSGTSFTYLDDPTYTRLSESFHSQARDKRRPPDSRIPFEYCYDMSPDANASLIPSVSLTMKGGSQFAVYDPIIVISTQSELVYCLAVVKSLELNIIGQNFMTGYHVVFDREKFVLGWKKFDCYDVEDHHAYLPFKPRSNNVPPGFAIGLGNHSISESSKKTRNIQTSVASLPYYSHTSLRTWFLLATLLFLLLLHYANVSVGTPRTSYLVALDTGSDLLWLPCDCISCVKGFNTSDGEVVDFDIYSPNKSTTSRKVPCNSTYCHEQRCSSPSSNCRYSIQYLSANTSSSGILVEDVLHLTTDGPKLKGVEAPIAFGCGKNQTGIFLRGTAPNGLLGLGMDDVSIPTMLAKQRLASNSFSMCFGLDGSGRIRFGDNGSVDQPETPFYIRDIYPTYNITVTQIAIGKSVADLEFYALWDSGTSFTYLNDPAYTQISESFNSAIKDKRVTTDSDIPFEYCYTISPNQTLNQTLNLTMKGGKQYNVITPLVFAYNSENGSIMFSCLGVVKSEDVNIIGQNFMTGYRIIFDREKMVLGWKESNCYNDEETSTLAASPSKSPAASPTVTPEAASPTVTPEATASQIPSPALPRSSSPKLNSFTCALIMLFSAIFALV